MTRDNSNDLPQDASPPVKAGKGASQGKLISVEALAALHSPGERLMGIDPGTQTIGIAVSDGMLTLAQGLETIRRSKFARDAARINEIVAANRVYGLVVGLPLNMDGSEGPRAQSVRAFVRNLSVHCDLPVVFWDERLSTVAAERSMIEADLSRRKRAERIDAAAAAFILQGVLDRMKNLR